MSKQTTISFKCPSCDRTLKAPEKAAGTRAECPKCGQMVTTPSPTGGTPAWSRRVMLAAGYAGVVGGLTLLIYVRRLFGSVPADDLVSIRSDVVGIAMACLWLVAGVGLWHSRRWGASLFWPAAALTVLSFLVRWATGTRIGVIENHLAAVIFGLLLSGTHILVSIGLLDFWRRKLLD